MSKQSDMQPNWHPNFRIESTLPDTRAIHTNFILKTVVYTAILIVAIFVLQREYQAYLLSQRISGLEQQIQSADSADRLRLDKSQQFSKLASNVRELQRFFRAPLVAHDSIAELALIKPEGVTFTRLILAESVVQVKRGRNSTSKVTFNLSISGDVQDLPVLTQFKRELEESQLLNPSGYTISIEETIQQRDPDTGIIPFKLSVPLKPAENKSTSKKKVK